MPTIPSSQVYNYLISGSRSINTEISSLSPSTQIFLYELDISEIAPTTINYPIENQPISNGVFRVYNDYNLFKISTDNSPQKYGAIKWQNNFYYPFPISTEGFEYTSAGALPTPRISISNLAPDYSANSFYRYLRMQIQSLGDIVGAKFTRIKTFLKYLDGSNFSGDINIFNPQTGLYEMELPKDIYYIDRKSLETKDTIQYDLASILDLENLTLPGRTLLSIKCPFQYRGEGCLYEYDSRLTSLHSGIYAGIENSPYQIRGLQTAPPVATENDQLFIGQGGVFDTGVHLNAQNAILRITGGAGNLGLWQNNYNYISGDFVFLSTKNIKFYYVCTNNHLSDFFNAPPNKNYWTSDSCSKSISACRLRWLKNPAFRPIIWPTNRNGETYTQTRNRMTWLYTTGERSLFITGNNNELINFPRRPGAENPSSEISHGIPKDANGNYLNGFLPFGGFPGTNQPQM